MARYAFSHVDVFTDTLFEGNPLAVFADARGIDDATMQRIARELNLSETTFVLPPAASDAAAAVRIFTPAYELPFAGHPTIGTAFVLYTTGAIPPEKRSFVFEERVGRVPVRVEEGDPFMAWLTTPPISFGPPIADRAAMARALDLDEEQLLSDVPVRVASAGSPFIYVALRDERAVDRAALDLRALEACVGDNGSTGVYVFALRKGGVYSRMFAPGIGVIEDPATGGATGPLTAFLIEHGLAPGNDGLRLICEQGTKMGRRSLLHVLVSETGGARKIEVGGSAVHAIDATIEF